MSQDYTREKLSVAVDALASSAASIQDRLANAGISALSRLKPDDFVAASDQVLFEEIMAALTAEEPVGQMGTIESTVRGMDDGAAVAVARDIMELHHSVLTP